MNAPFRNAAELIQPVDSQHVDFLRDESRRAGSADTISFPRSEAEAAAILTELFPRRVPITVQGARTGIVAGAVPEGGHVLSFARMVRATGMRRDSATGAFLLSVQPGLLLADLRRMLHSRAIDTEGWSAESLAVYSEFKNSPEQFFPPDPTETSASLGGMVSCNASGACSFAFGPTSRHIESVRVLLADGSPLQVRRTGAAKAEGRVFRLETENGRVLEGVLPDYQVPPVKSAAGYPVRENMELIDLFIGMEGTLGVLTEIELRLSPSPRHVFGFLAFLPDEAGALQFVRALRREILPEIEQPLTACPVAIEFFNHGALSLLRHQKATNPAFADLPEIEPEHHTAIYTEYQGDDEQAVNDAILAAAEALAVFGGSPDEALAADNPAMMEKLKKFRHAVPEAVNLLIGERKKTHPNLTKLGTDMSVPNDELEYILTMYNQDLEKAGLESVIFGHVGDNHLHVNILPNSPEEYQRGRAIYLEWARKAVALGGSVSAEHGIGKLKTAFLEIMAGTEGIAQMRALKKIFDPEGLLNPGNLFPLSA